MSLKSWLQSVFAANQPATSRGPGVYLQRLGDVDGLQLRSVEQGELSSEFAGSLIALLEESAAIKSAWLLWLLPDDDPELLIGLYAPTYTEVETVAFTERANRLRGPRCAVALSGGNGTDTPFFQRRTGESADVGGGAMVRAEALASLVSTARTCLIHRG